MKRNLLLTGASGLLGWNMQERLARDFEVFAHYQKNKFIRDECIPCQFDLKSGKTLKKILQEIKPEVVIHAAALTSIAFCEENPEDTFRINRDSTGILASICADMGCKFVFFSTDIVFDGEQGNYIETDELNPLNVYGESKAQAEGVIAKSTDDFLILRISMTYGFNNNVHKCFAGKLIDSFNRGEIQNLYTNQIRCPNYAGDTAEITARLLSSGERGIFHCAGPEALSRYEIGKLIADKFSFDIKKINPVKVDEYLLPFKNGIDCSLNSDKAYRATGVKSISLGEGIDIIKTSF